MASQLVTPSPRACVRGFPTLVAATRSPIIAEQDNVLVGYVAAEPDRSFGVTNQNSRVLT